MVNSGFNKMLRVLYLIGMGVMVFTGFGNMPIYKRYYISDVPGLGWSADFVGNVSVHYLVGAVVLFIVGYLGLTYILEHRQALKLTVTGWIRTLLVAVIIGTGFVMLLKNLPSIRLDQTFMIIMNLSHMGSVMVFLFFSLGCLIAKAKWLKAAS